MKLTKQEQTAIIGNLINHAIGLELVKEHIAPLKLKKAVALYNEISDDMTPKQTRESLINVLDKTIDVFLVNKE
ncbi:MULTISPECIES: hypothetical protein [Bacillus]|uniref:hypothetical protein n=1 Tax=Bacillus TaxID=1386 RepID=UPI000BF23FAA|nr:hypothetical protein [Bacillus mycoides]PEK92934.1 hypothetical protein CN600_17205 [Bacillus mycoides]QWG83928.1 hypothetical protein EXW61_10595 [Bacillus mycoides]HDR7635980.1 hypothetical protein [Bacillus mycoides]